jgi:ubiquinone/menaquinone biosynthesis C-methylase UbiE
MGYPRPLLSAVAFLAVLQPATAAMQAQRSSTRIADASENARTGSDSYPFRSKSEYILSELDVRPGDVVVDIGAGDGWWTERIAELVGDEGVVHAAEVDEKKVEGMKRKFEDVPRIKPYVCPTDGTDLPENSCDLAFISQVYHHFALNGHVAYLRHLAEVVKPNGRVCVIERLPQISTRQSAHATPISRLAKQAEEAGWVLVRYELMPRTYHYLAIFAQREMFPAEPQPRRGSRRGNRRRKGGDDEPAPAPEAVRSEAATLHFGR